MGQARTGQGGGIRPQSAGGQGAQGCGQRQGAKADTQAGRAALSRAPAEQNANLRVGVLHSRLEKMYWSYWPHREQAHSYNEMRFPVGAGLPAKRPELPSNF
ncbi:hypothetical protein EMIT0P74_230036 [Pseudomonas sp. IT-P74]